MGTGIVLNLRHQTNILLPKDQTGKSFCPMMIANMAAGQVSIAVGVKV